MNHIIYTIIDAETHEVIAESTSYVEVLRRLENMAQYAPGLVLARTFRMDMVVGSPEPTPTPTRNDSQGGTFHA